MTPRGRILIVDDEANARMALADILRDEGYQVETAADGFKALPKLDDFAPDLLLTDLKMPGMDGLELMAKAHAKDPDLVVVLMTAFGAVETAVAAMRQGALEYLTKPIHTDKLMLTVERALERRRLRAEAGHLRRRLEERNRIRGIIGSSPAMQRVHEMILQVAPSQATVLITGESGTGKELVAAAIHEHSRREGRPFVKLHCGALAESLLESELFGHERGSFTGAAGRREGRLKQADTGTLFLDEIGDITPATQVKLLRFLQEHELERVGGNQTLKLDVRIIAATNRDLRSLVQEGKFREDLYYRLNVVTIEMPPLRARPGDVALLAVHFLEKYTRDSGKRITGFTPEALTMLSAHSWPGNVRELENTIERATVVCRGDVIGKEALVLAAENEASFHDRDQRPPIPGSSIAQIERYAILKTLEHTNGSTSRAAAILGISPRTIQYRLQEYYGRGPRPHHPA